MGRGEKVWTLLKHQADPTMRSYLMERLGPGGVDPKVLTVRLEEEKEVSVKRAILLSLGEFGLDRLPLVERRNHLRRLLELYRDDPDSGIHGVAEWLLRRWSASDELEQMDKGLATGKPEGKRQWYINRQGQTMMIFSRPHTFWMGEDVEKHRRKIDRSFAIASKEVTVEQFRTIMKRDPSDKRDSPTPDCPATSISWHDAAEYCNELSKKENIRENEWCYVPSKAGEHGAEMAMAPNYLQRTGYRLPTEVEWEFSCRANSETTFSFGEAEDVLGKYGWYLKNASDTTHSVGKLKPNDFGLYDLHGNGWEWCQTVYKPYPKGGGNKSYDDKEDDIGTNTDSENRVLRGGASNYVASNVRSAYRNFNAPTHRHYNFSFRVARTLPPSGLTALPPSCEGVENKK
jgi:formylglycine-generating enzyme required for sulfatase activity